MTWRIEDSKKKRLVRRYTTPHHLDKHLHTRHHCLVPAKAHSALIFQTPSETTHECLCIILRQRFLLFITVSKMHPVVIKQLDWMHLDATLLREAQQLEINDLRPIGPGISASSANVPVFLVAYDGDEPVGCGGLRPLDSQGLPGQVEIKRMYVVPSRRGSGDLAVAPSILETLERSAKEHGWTVLKIETSKAMAQARKFYEKHDYVPCDVFGGYRGSEHSVCYEKHLV
jgi:putative acetyltransferase